ncbi:Holliday junction branch migration protein RuvA [Secundilactobacillus malefermentans]|uniref:Holliday junction branch migration complex subunit RuvA n=1 Tax=Secundilactobacillus malefermentans TaxID=176292 RepID=A0A4R5NJH4_9LACO|nr:Holliday junction branch migration protein RuvA [Secundilactobacillus malefermentans]KRM59216.1 Holliday junction ATP-dependent DNA helicase ruvA [Secundilactobacillus malefermentans DSM 5705 = KCTC 3548]QEA32205.1 Holliday junction branch migration protein RuvA [Secundilactobacillus malefermentans]TDG74344.1 hypothetical protein C5L31_000911 [Secundilactobacillus malefermentans]
MYEYLEGTVSSVQPDHIVVDVNGVGYFIYTGNPYHFQIGEKYKVYVHQTISDSAQSLYGFATYEEKQLFEKLLNVSGIGSKSALAILANEDHHGIVNAINQENVSFLVKFPGIGKKTAQQIILDLKGKLGEFVDDAGDQIEIHLTANQQLDDALAALEALGYSSREVSKIKPALDELDVSTTDQYLSEGLKRLMK